MKFLSKISLFLLLQAVVLAQGLVTITASPAIRRADGSLANGAVFIRWQSFTTATGITVTAGTLNLNLASGVFTTTLQLYPNVGASPPGTSYQVTYQLSGGPNYVRNWYVPAGASATVQQIEFPPAGLVGTTAIVSPAQLTQAGAGVGQALAWNGAMWAPANGGGSGGNPCTTTGNSIQYNNSGTFGCLGLGTTTSVLHGNASGIATFGQVVGADIANATIDLSTKTTGILGVTQGGTGTSTQFTTGSVVFSGASGVYTQDNANFFWDGGNHRLGIGTITPSIKLHVNSGGITDAAFFQTTGAFSDVWLADSGTTAGSIRVRAASNALSLINNGEFVTLYSTGDWVFGGAMATQPPDSGYRFDVQGRGSTSMARFYDQASDGVTSVTIQAGLAQNVCLLCIKSNGGTLQTYVNGTTFGTFSNQFADSNATSTFSLSNSGSGLSLANTSGVQFSSTNAFGGSVDLRLYRNSAGVLEINNGTPGTFRDLTLRNITLSGTCTGCPGSGSGTVTNTAGPLAAGRLVVGNGGNDELTLASLGTTTTLLHGNAGGNPSFGAVVLTTDVSGTLPFANGGLGTAANFANHLFFGNNSGSTAAPIAVQPTFADLAAGTVGAVAVFPGGDLFTGGVNAQSGTTYAMLTSDENKLVTFNNGSAVAVSLVQATTTGFTSGASFHIFNRGAGAVTITPATSTINGGATAVLNQNQGAYIVSDGTNYSAWISAAPTGSGTVTSIATTSPITGGTITTTGTIACATCVTSPASLTNNQIVLGGGGQSTSTLGSLGTTTTLLHGNAAGIPAFSAVVNGDIMNGTIDLAAKVTGVLPFANGGTNTTLGPPQAYQGGCAGVATSSTSNLNVQLNVNLTCTSNSNTFEQISILAPAAGTLRNLRVHANTGGVNGSSGVFTVNTRGGGATSLTCTVGTGTTCNDTTHTAAYSAGEQIYVTFSTQGSETLGDVSVSFQY